jgi:hypothetical protein
MDRTERYFERRVENAKSESVEFAISDGVVLFSATYAANLVVEGITVPASI